MLESKIWNELKRAAISKYGDKSTGLSQFGYTLQNNDYATHSERMAIADAIHNLGMDESRVIEKDLLAGYSLYVVGISTKRDPKVAIYIATASICMSNMCTMDRSA